MISICFQHVCRALKLESVFYWTNFLLPSTFKEASPSLETLFLRDTISQFMKQKDEQNKA